MRPNLANRLTLANVNALVQYKYNRNDQHLLRTCTKPF